MGEVIQMYPRDTRSGAVVLVTGGGEFLPRSVWKFLANEMIGFVGTVIATPASEEDRPQISDFVTALQLKRLSRSCEGNLMWDNSDIGFHLEDPLQGLRFVESLAKHYFCAAVMLGGNERTIQQIEAVSRSEIPLIVIRKSGGAADELVFQLAGGNGSFSTESITSLRDSGRIKFANVDWPGSLRSELLAVHILPTAT